MSKWGRFQRNFHNEARKVSEAEFKLGLFQGLLICMFCRENCNKLKTQYGGGWLCTTAASRKVKVYACPRCVQEKYREVDDDGKKSFFRVIGQGIAAVTDKTDFRLFFEDHTKPQGFYELRKGAELPDAQG